MGEDGCISTRLLKKLLTSAVEKCGMLPACLGMQEWASMARHLPSSEWWQTTERYILTEKSLPIWFQHTAACCYRIRGFCRQGTGILWDLECIESATEMKELEPRVCDTHIRPRITREKFEKLKLCAKKRISRLRLVTSVLFNNPDLY